MQILFKPYILGGNVTFSTILQQILIESHIIGVQIPHPLALYGIASSKVCHKIELSSVHMTMICVYANFAYMQILHT